ncbi:hypothetical protein OQA88_11240 [Cercophora sp. LCS_1]
MNGNKARSALGQNPTRPPQPQASSRPSNAMCVEQTFQYRAIMKYKERYHRDGFAPHIDVNSVYHELNRTPGWTVASKRSNHALWNQVSKHENSLEATRAEVKLLMEQGKTWRECKHKFSGCLRPSVMLAWRVLNVGANGGKFKKKFRDVWEVLQLDWILAQDPRSSAPNFWKGAMFWDNGWCDNHLLEWEPAKPSTLPGNNHSASLGVDLNGVFRAKAQPGESQREVGGETHSGQQRTAKPLPEEVVQSTLEKASRVLRESVAGPESAWSAADQYVLDQHIEKTVSKHELPTDEHLPSTGSGSALEQPTVDSQVTTGEQKRKRKHDHKRRKSTVKPEAPVIKREPTPAKDDPQPTQPPVPTPAFGLNHPPTRPMPSQPTGPSEGDARDQWPVAGQDHPIEAWISTDSAIDPILVATAVDDST